MNKNKKLWVGSISITLAILFFAIFLVVQKSMQEEPECRMVLCAQIEIPENTHITEENASHYLQQKLVPVEWIPKGCLSEWQEVYDTVWKTKIAEGTILTDTMRDDYQSLYKAYKELTWISVPIKELYQGVAGSLRSGDYVDIYFIGEKEDQVVCELLAERVRILSAYSYQGQNVAADSSDGLTQLIVIPMEKSTVASFYEKMAQGNIRIAKYEK